MIRSGPRVWLDVVVARPEGPESAPDVAARLDDSFQPQDIY